MIDLKKREELENAATPGPWRYVREEQSIGRGLSMIFATIQAGGVNLVRHSTNYAGHFDADLCAYYRNDAAEVNDWMREAVRLAGASALAASAHGDHDLAKRLRAHIEKVKL